MKPYTPPSSRAPKQTRKPTGHVCFCGAVLLRVPGRFGEYMKCSAAGCTGAATIDRRTGNPFPVTNQATRDARKSAHAVYEAVKKQGAAAERAVAAKLNVRKIKIGRMNETQCKQLMQLVLTGEATEMVCCPQCGGAGQVPKEGQ